MSSTTASTRARATATAPGGRSLLSRLAANRLMLAGLAMIVFVVAFSFLGPLLYPTDQTSTNLAQALQPPSAAHPLGTDNLGYDVLGRLMIAGRTSLVIGVAAALIATVFGTVWGAVAGLAGRVADAVMMRIVDVFMAVPAVLLLLLIASIFTPSVIMLIIVIALVAWLIPARLMRGETLALRTREFVQAAKNMGAGTGYSLRRHILPNALGTITVYSTYQVADAVLAITSISFLGLGLAPPATDWGAMLSSGINYIYANAWWTIYPPGLMIVITVLAFNFLGEALNDVVGARASRLEA